MTTTRRRPLSQEEIEAWIEVRVVVGPLFGHDELVAGMPSHQRVTVLLQALGRVTLSRGDVRAI